ncbi:MAG: phosphonoacetaldehyde reductase [Akkermansiaceae bacterium]
MQKTNVLSDMRAHFGEITLGELKQSLDTGGHRSVLLVTGRGFLESCGLMELIAPSLRGRQVLRVSNFETNPKKQDLERLLCEIAEFPFSAIIGIGGGSAVDMAKLVKCFHGQPERITEVLEYGSELMPSDTELFAIPTTAGSGSEATHFAVIYDEGVKYSVAHKALLPAKSWVLPSVLATVPLDVAAAAAMDAFCQGVESYWCINATTESKKIARRAIKLAWENMVSAVVKKEPEALAEMGKASHLAGMAINLTKTTAPHAISYALTTHLGLLHGHAVGLVLPSIFCYNEGVTFDDVLDARGVGYVQETLFEIVEIIGAEDVSSASFAITQKMQEMKLSTRLSEVGAVGQAEHELIIRDGFNPDRVNNNPRRLTEQALRNLLQAVD